MSVDRLVVVGASLAGLRAVEAARRASFTGSVTLIGDEPHLPYDRPPLSKAVLEPDTGVDAPTFRSLDTLHREMRVDLRLGERAAGLDPRRGVVCVDGTEVGYDALVIATGSVPRMLPGADHLDGVHALRTIDDARAIRAALDGGARTVLVGAGFIGAEVASAARKRGLPVTIVEALEVPLLHAVGAEMGAALAELHRRNGVDLHCGVQVLGVEGEQHVERVRLSDGTAVDADLVVVGIGSTPATGWLDGSGVTVEAGVVCDETLASSTPGIYAAGDVVQWHNPAFGEPMRLEHWTSAAEQGAIAAANAVALAPAKTYATVPYFWSDWYGHRIQFVGLAAADEVSVAAGSLDPERFIALYRRGDRLIGALALNCSAQIMKYRALIAKNASWSDALEFAQARPLAATQSH